MINLEALAKDLESAGIGSEIRDYGEYTNMSVDVSSVALLVESSGRVYEFDCDSNENELTVSDLTAMSIILRHKDGIPTESTYKHGEEDDQIEAHVSTVFWHKGPIIRFEVEAFGGSYDDPHQSASHDMPFEDARKLALWILEVTK